MRHTGERSSFIVSQPHAKSCEPRLAKAGVGGAVHRTQYRGGHGACDLFNGGAR
jgi:hypothetical protein